MGCCSPISNACDLLRLSISGNIDVVEAWGRGEERAGNVSAPLHQLIERCGAGGEWTMPAGDKGMGKGERERAEVSRSRAATSHLSCCRGQSRRAGGRWWQSHSVLPPLPTLYRNAFPPPKVPFLVWLTSVSFQFLIPILHLLYLPHNVHLRHLSNAVTHQIHLCYRKLQPERLLSARSPCWQHILVFTWLLNNYVKMSCYLCIKTRIKYNKNKEANWRWNIRVFRKDTLTTNTSFKCWYISRNKFF